MAIAVKQLREDDRPYRYESSSFDFGTFYLSIPEKLSAGDLEYLERLFTLALRQARRRANPPSFPKHPYDCERAAMDHLIVRE